MYVHGKISRRNAGEKRALATCDESLLFKRVYFKRHQDFFNFYIIFRCISCEHLPWPQMGRNIFAASHLWPLTDVPPTNCH